MADICNLVIVGHVDHGKSTLSGRLLADTGNLPTGKLEQIKKHCEQVGRNFEYAFVLDSLREEQSKGITIDVTRIFFRTKKRKYMLLDAPGHVEFLQNMVTGAAKADAAVLVIDAKEGIRENTKRHALLLSLLGVKQIVVAVNKMDSVSYSQDIYQKVKSEYQEFLTSAKLSISHFVPVSAYQGENLFEKSKQMLWYHGPSLLDVVDGFQVAPNLSDKDLRLPIQDIYHFPYKNEKASVFAGNIESGTLSVGDKVIFHPSGAKGQVHSFVGFPEDSILKKYEAGQSVSFRLVEENINIHRGDLCTKERESLPQQGRKIWVKLFWLGKESFVKGKKYTLKLTTFKTTAQALAIESVLNSESLEILNQDWIGSHQVGTALLQLDETVCFDLEGAPSLSRFVLIDTYQICGGGQILSGDVV